MKHFVHKAKEREKGSTKLFIWYSCCDPINKNSYENELSAFCWAGKPITTSAPGGERARYQ